MLRSFNLRAALGAASLFLLSTLSLGLASQAPARADYSEVILHDFNQNQLDGQDPQSGLTQGPDGTLYGTTLFGGQAPYGTVYKLNQDGNVVILHEFGDGSVAQDGLNPYAGITIGSDGSLYGTTSSGGAYGYGVVFKLAPDGTYLILHMFSGGADGAHPYAGLTFSHNKVNGDKLYGVTWGDGQNDSAEYGTLYSISPDGSNYAVMYRFGPSNGPTVGEEPEGTLTPNPSTAYGGFYGTTYIGGAGNVGTLFNFALDKNGTVGKLTVLHTFCDGSVANDGSYPQYGRLQVDSSGTIYGTTTNGGEFDDGTVFKLAPDKTETILHSFTNDYYDGGVPNGGLILASDGNYYGTTFVAGTSISSASEGDGTVFRIAPDGGNYATVYNFGDSGANDGKNPFTPVFEDSDGNLVGTTEMGGTYYGKYSYGTIYKVLAGLPNPVALTGFSLDQTSVTGGQTNATGTVTLSRPAPSAGAVVALTSSNPSAASVPSSVTVPANSETATFPVTSHAVSSSKDVTITASYNGGAQTATLTVTPVPVTLKSVVLSPTSTPGGTSTTANRVYFTADATDAAVVSLSSSNTAVATVPSTITFETGHSSRTFTITTKSATSTQTVTITAKYNGAMQTATLTVTPPPVTLKSVLLSSASVQGSTSTTGNRVYLTGDAPADTAVSLSSSNTAVATVNSSVTVTQGTTSHTFTIKTKAVTSQQTVTITATLNGVSKTATLTVTP